MKFLRISTSRTGIGVNLKATILAAGVGSRLGDLGRRQPKGLIEIGGEPIVYRSIRLLQEAGIGDISIVVGHKSEMYERAVESFPSVRLLYNREYSSGGSTRSLALAAEWASSDLIVLDSDIVYGFESISVLIASKQANAVLVSGVTGAGDEVWVYGDKGRAEKISKTPDARANLMGEFVGISKLGKDILTNLRAVKVGSERTEPSEYEAFISQHCRDYPVEICLVEDLIWGEIDTDSQLARIRYDVFPRLLASERGVLGQPSD